jgi:hypothetical protein
MVNWPFWKTGDTTEAEGSAGFSEPEEPEAEPAPNDETTKKGGQISRDYL